MKKQGQSGLAFLIGNGNLLFIKTQTLSVSKKLGNAVTRNQIKRYIRQAFLELKDEVRTGNDYVIIARKPAAEMGMQDIKKSLEHVLKVARVLKKRNNGHNDGSTRFSPLIG
ncbi:ribonuclease P protein component [Mesobacillus maritimus]|uniref:ribonuclease P protein component n=1 Tax=Mesobacillus maritimus TaxID=1643336 RepID=UPI00384A70B1